MHQPLPRRRVAALAALGAAALVSGCSGRTDSRLRAAFVTSGSTESLDPHTGVQFVDQARAKALFDTLVTYRDDMSVRPRLAETWDSDPSGRRWRIRLRPATFHDGRPVTADDVLFTFRRIADPRTAAASAPLLGTVDFAASRALSPRDVELVLTAPNFEFPAVWGAPSTEIVPAGTTDFSRPVGSGPFRLVSFDPGATSVFRRWDGHWDTVPTVDEIEFVPIDDEQARVNALLSGQVDYAHDLSAPSAARLRDERRVRLLDAPRSVMQAVSLRVDRPPFSDPRLRAAVLAGVDREALVRVALDGRGEIGNDLFGKGLRGYASGIGQRVRDVGLARSLVTAAGARSTAVALETSGVDPSFEPAAALIAEQLGEIGLTVTPNVRAASSYFTEIKTKGVAAHTRTATLPLATFLEQRMRSGSASNVTGFSSPAFDSLLDRAAGTRDEAERLRLLAEAQSIARDGSGLLVWGFSNWVVGVSNRVHGLRAAPPNSVDWARFDRARLG